MKAPHLTAVSAAIAALLAPAPAASQAQQISLGVLAGPLSPQPGSGSLYPVGGSLYPTPVPRAHDISGSRGFNRGTHRGFNGGFIFYEEPHVVHDIVVVHDQPTPPPPPSPPAPPSPGHVIGHSYDSLPGGCMKMVERGVSYFHCSGDWYREVAGRRYEAVEVPL